MRSSFHILRYPEAMAQDPEEEQERGEASVDVSPDLDMVRLYRSPGAWTFPRPVAGQGTQRLSRQDSDPLVPARASASRAALALGRPPSTFPK